MDNILKILGKLFVLRSLFSIVDFLNRNNLFGCKITLKTVSRDPKDLARHLSGKKFQKALAKKEQGMLVGF